MINLVGYSLSPTLAANQRDSQNPPDSSLSLVPALESVSSPGRNERGGSIDSRSSGRRSSGSNSGEPQAELSVNDVGTLIKNNKKHVTWTFPDKDGKEHTVGLLWNKYTGKIVVAMDGTEVWSGHRRGFDIISHKWETEDGMQLHLFASRTTPDGSPPGYCKYGLVVDNKEYILVPKEDGILDPQDSEQASRGSGSNATLPASSSSWWNAPSSIVELLYPNGYGGGGRRSSKSDDGSEHSEEHKSPV
eukprot:scaffold73_cov118-Cylindrotheca_fusiformis.AAC.10